jgi:hypothetical protein
MSVVIVSLTPPASRIPGGVLSAIPHGLCVLDLLYRFRRRYHQQDGWPGTADPPTLLFR